VRATARALSADQPLLPIGEVESDTPAMRPRRVPVRAHLRTVAGEAPPSGRQLRDAALADHEADEAKAAAIAYLREHLTALYQSRAATWPASETPFVNADDADRLLREWAECPAAIYDLRSQNWKGAVFARGFARTGTHQRSLRRHMRATELPGWKPLTPSTP
jgi:hypothetical protein